MGWGNPLNIFYNFRDQLWDPGDDFGGMALIGREELEATGQSTHVKFVKSL